MADFDRENEALDALIVLALRGYDLDGVDDFESIDPDNLPELTDEDRVAMEKIDINAVIAEANRRMAAKSDQIQDERSCP